jgi:ComF family protein
MIGFLIKLIFPKLCFICEKNEDYLCSKCKCELVENICSYKKDLLANFKTRECFLEDALMAYEVNEILLKLLKAMKYRFIRGINDLFVDSMIKQITKNGFQNFEIAFVPVDKKRLKWRGFNQAEVLAEKISIRIRGPCRSKPAHFLLKVRSTNNQAKLDRDERIRNLSGAFVINEVLVDEVQGKDFLLIDDIATSFSTLNECARILKETGANQVISLTVCRAI